MEPTIKVFPFVRDLVNQAYDSMRKSMSEPPKKIRGPLVFLTETLGLDFLDEEWKRVLFFGFILTVSSFFIALFGNLIQSDGEQEEEYAKAIEQEEEDELERLKRERLKQEEEFETPEMREYADEGEEALDLLAGDEAYEEVVGEDLEVDDDVVEEAKEQSMEKGWSLLSEVWKNPDGGSKQFADMAQSIRPRWLTSEISSNLTLVSNLYSRLFNSWMQSHSFNSPVSLTAMLAGLFFRDFNNEVKNVEDIDNATLAEAHYYLQFANACYAQDLLSAGILLRSVKKACLGARTGEEPWLRHVLFVDHLTKSVVLMIRGTSDFEDMIVDLLAEEVEFMGGVAHKGLLHEARSIVSEIGPILKSTLQECGYKTLVVTGHSLGGGSAVLSSILFRHEFSGLEKIAIKCYVFGSPPVLGPPDAFPKDDPRFKDIDIISFVNNADVICRTSLYGLETGIRLWIAIDSIKEFGFGDKLHALMKGKLPEEITEKAMALLRQTESRSKYKKMITPGKCVWLVKQDSEYVVSCPDDPLSISSQPMFVGTTWLHDHSLIQYKAALESV